MSQEVYAWLSCNPQIRREIDRLVSRESDETGLLRRSLDHLANDEPDSQERWQQLLFTLRYLEELRAEPAVLAAAVLSHEYADAAELPPTLVDEFGDEILGLLQQLRELRRVAAAGGTRTDAVRAEGLRRLLLAVVNDVRVVLIRLCEQLSLLRVLVKNENDESRRSVARETTDVYAPLANRLGAWQLKWEMEDLSFRILEPGRYQQIAQMLDERRDDRDSYVQRFVEELRSKLADAGIDADVAGRSKHIYSIWRKLTSKQLEFQELSDLRAVRVLVEDVATCYGVLGQVHALWLPIRGEFDDYIATPKGNFYRSLHTAVIGPEGRTVEIQIRTHDMHKDAELGVAAHWRYKEGGQHDDEALNRRVLLMRRLLEWGERSEDHELLEAFASESEQRVYVLTPAGDVVDLPAGATPLDFAYRIHTDVGHRCRGAKINGRIAPLTHELKSGEQVEVLTTRNGEPARDWLNPHLGYLRSARARAKVRQWFRQMDFGRHVAEGRDLLSRELERLGLGSVELKPLLARFNFKRIEQLLAAIGAGDITPLQVARLAENRPGPRLQEPRTPLKLRSARPVGPTGITIEGVGNLMTTLARCCKPVPDDTVVGYITRGRGVTIHRRDCSNMLRVGDEDRRRLIQVQWGFATSSTYPVDLELEAWDRKGLLRDISAVLADSDSNVTQLNTSVDDSTGVARITVTVEIADIEVLSRILARLTILDNVVSARRRN